MYTKEFFDKYLEILAEYNLNIFPLSIILPVSLSVIVIILIFYSNKKPGKKSSDLFRLFLGALYIYAGFQIIIGIFELELFLCLTGTICMWLFSILLFLDIKWNKTTFQITEHKDARIIGFLLIFSGLILYPVIETLTGLNWPRMVFIGAECPTTIVVIGILILTIPKTNRLLLFLFSILAIISGFSAALVGIHVDFLYGAAGVIGIIFLIRYWNSMELAKMK